MSAHNICFREIRKILCGYPFLSVAMITCIFFVCSLSTVTMYHGFIFIILIRVILYCVHLLRLTM